jgi:selenide,water dikinase
MTSLSVPAPEGVLVGTGTGDDAGVYRLSDTQALVQTVDFITPIVDDPHTYGRIAAANSLSDVYAMGGVPLTALNIVCFPTDTFTLSILSDVLSGGISKIEEAGVALLGGHSVEDPEMKYGLSVTGLVHPARILRNNTLREGDLLLLTKSLGTGIISTAVKAGMFDLALLAGATDSMATLNKTASEIMNEYDVSACTDVTGFGLAGHAAEMTGGGELSIRLFASGMPVLPGARDSAETGLIPAGMYNNREYLADRFSRLEGVEQLYEDIAFDPQTSGGLLFSIHPDRGEACLRELRDRGVEAAAIVGQVEKRKGSGAPSVILAP